MGVDPTRAHKRAGTYDSERRMLGLSFFSNDGTWSNLQVLGVHGQDRYNSPTDAERGHWASCMRGTLDKFWKGGPLVVLGDLNANPFHDEITGRAGLHAVRKKDGIGESRKLPQMQKSSISLYNPMWSLLVDDAGKAPGTYYHSSRTRTDLLWHCIDQIIVSAHLEPHLIGGPEIQTHLTGDAVTSLVDSDGVPLRSKGEPVYSDHLPVQLSIDIKKVDVCRTSAKP